MSNPRKNFQGKNINQRNPPPPIETKPPVAEDLENKSIQNLKNLLKKKQMALASDASQNQASTTTQSASTVQQTL